MITLRKDTSIWSLIAQLAARLDGQTFQVVDHWDADLFAIGIAGIHDTRRLVYVSTFRKKSGFFAYECEGADGSLDSEIPASSEQADLPELLRVLERYTGIAPGDRIS